MAPVKCYNAQAVCRKRIVKKIKDTEYSALRMELIHYDTACLTILGSLLTAAAAGYGFIAEKQTYYLLPLLSAIWFVGYFYMLDKRISILKIALYIQTKFETHKEGYFWESWLANDGSYLENRKLCLPKEVCLSRLNFFLEPEWIEFFLLQGVNILNAGWLWQIVFTSKTPPFALCGLTTGLSILSSAVSNLAIASYRSFKARKRKFSKIDILLTHKK